MNTDRLLSDAAGLPPDPVYDPTHLHLNRYQAIPVPRLWLGPVEILAVWFWLPAILVPVPYGIVINGRTLEYWPWRVWVIWKRDRPLHTPFWLVRQRYQKYLDSFPVRR